MKMKQKVMTIDVYDDGSIVGNRIRDEQIVGITPDEDLEVTMAANGDKIKYVIPTTIMITERNPTCGWVKIGQQWYWVCG